MRRLWIRSSPTLLLPTIVFDISIFMSLDISSFLTLVLLFSVDDDGSSDDKYSTMKIFVLCFLMFPDF